MSSEIKDRHEEIGRMMEHGHILIGEKAQLIHQLKDEMNKNSETSNKIKEMMEIGKKEAEFVYKRETFSKTNDHKQQIKNLKEQYDHLIEQADSEHSKFVSEANGYTKTKKADITVARKEISDLFEIVKA